jgi:hypothetical protein
MREKHIIDFFDVEIALHFAQDNLDVKKVLAPSKNPAKCLIMCFYRLQNIKSLTSKNSGTLIVITQKTKILKFKTSQRMLRQISAIW